MNDISLAILIAQDKAEQLGSVGNSAAAAFAGGVPVERGDRVVGADRGMIEEDRAIAEAGIAALDAPQ